MSEKGDLVLHLRREWWERIRRGEKTEEYRLVTPYWTRRLEGRTFARVVLLLGYPSRDDASRRIVRRFGGIERKTIVHPLFGDEPVEAYAIRLLGGCDE